MNRRELIRMTDAEVEEFVAGRRTMCVATNGPSGHPHVVAMWYGFLDGAPALWTYAKSQKVVNLRRDPRLSCLIEDGDEYASLRGVELVGTGRIIEDRSAVQQVGESIFERYFGAVGGPEAVAVMGAKRVVVVVEVLHVVSWDHSKLAGAY